MVLSKLRESGGELPAGLDHAALVTSTEADEGVIGGVALSSGLPSVFDAAVQWAAVDDDAASGCGEFCVEDLGRNAIVEVSRHAIALAAQRVLPGDFRRSVLSMLRR